MKKLILISLLAGFMLTEAQETVELSLGVVVNADRIEFKSLEYIPSRVVTNVTYDWVDVTDIRTNLYYGMKPDEVVTNDVRKQIEVVSVVTNAAYWVAPFEYEIPAGEQMLIAGSLDARPRRNAIMDVRLVLSHEQLVAILGKTMADSTRAASETYGPLQVRGAIAGALRGAVIQVMVSGN